MNHIGLLRQTTLLRHFTDSELAELSQSATVRRLSRHETLAYEGQESKSLFVLMRGAVRLYFEGYDGREQVISVVHAVTTFNELVLFDDGLQPFSISACEDSLVLCLRVAQLRQKFSDSLHPAADALQLIASQLRGALDLVRSLSLLDVAQRLAHFLLDYAHLHGTRCPDGIHVHLDLSNQEIGETVGAVREVISRAMARLQRNGLIVCSGKALVIPDDALLLQFIGKRDRRESVHTSVVSMTASDSLALRPRRGPVVPVTGRVVGKGSD
jgi:CRP/FNR family transcriptional regulator